MALCLQCDTQQIHCANFTVGGGPKGVLVESRPRKTKEERFLGKEIIQGGI